MVDYRKLDKIIEQAFWNSRHLEKPEDRAELALKLAFREIYKMEKEPCHADLYCS